MVMSYDEIQRRYNLAKDKALQIEILAQLNDCKESEIKEILANNGIVVKKEKKKEVPECILNFVKNEVNRLSDEVFSLNKQKERLKRGIKEADQEIALREKRIEEIEKYMNW